MEEKRTNEELVQDLQQGWTEVDPLEEDFEAYFGTTPFDEVAFTWTPRLIFDYLNEYIFGQEKAKRAAAILVYNHLAGRRRNMVVAGPTGCGKTEIWRVLQKEFPFIKIVNGPQLACDGWKGSYHVKDIFLSEEFPEDMEHLLVVIDEADKLFEPAVGSSGTDFARNIQNEFLKIMDGDTVTFVEENKQGSQSVTISCENISFVFCGSFETLLQNKALAPKAIGFSGTTDGSGKESCCITEEDLITYGNVRREIAGRIQQIVAIDPLEADDYEKIMDSDKKMSPIRQLETAYGIHMSVDPGMRKKLAKKASESRLGCRYIKSRLQNMLDDQMFDDPEKKDYQLSDTYAG